MAQKYHFLHWNNTANLIAFIDIINKNKGSVYESYFRMIRVKNHVDEH